MFLVQSLWLLTKEVKSVSSTPGTATGLRPATGLKAPWPILVLHTSTNGGQKHTPVRFYHPCTVLMFTGGSAAHASMHRSATQVGCFAVVAPVPLTENF